MDFAILADAVRRRWYLPVLCAVAAAGLALVWLTVRPPTYTASADILITPAPTDSGGARIRRVRAEAASQLLSNASTYLALAKSDAVLQDTIDELGLDTDVDSLAKNLVASSGQQSTVVTLTVTGETPEGTAALAKTLSDRFSDMVAQTSLDEEDEPVLAATTVRAPQVPRSPSSPPLPVMLAAAAMLGLAVGTGWAVIRYQSDRSLHDGVDVTRLLGSSPLGVITGTGKNAPVAAAEDQYRRIRSRLMFSDPPPRLITVMPASAGQLRNDVCLGLAGAYAEAGRSVCLVDAMPVSGARGSSSQSDSGAIGLAQVLAGTHELTSALAPANLAGVTLLGAGGRPQGSADVATSPKTAQVIEELRRSFDIVILNAPAATAATEGLVAAGEADGVVLVAKSDVTTSDEVLDLLRAIAEVGATLLGCVLVDTAADGSAPIGAVASASFGGAATGDSGGRSDIARPTESQSHGDESIRL